MVRKRFWNESRLRTARLLYVVQQAMYFDTFVQIERQEKLCCQSVGWRQRFERCFDILVTSCSVCWKDYLQHNLMSTLMGLFYGKYTPTVTCRKLKRKSIRRWLCATRFGQLSNTVVYEIVTNRRKVLERPERCPPEMWALSIDIANAMSLHCVIVMKWWLTAGQWSVPVVLISRRSAIASTVRMTEISEAHQN